MSGTVDIDLFKMIMFYMILLIPVFILAKLKMKMTLDIVWAVVRMTVQLTLVGLYLKYIFVMNNVWITALWLAVMLISTNTVVLNRAGLKKRVFFLPTLVSIAFSALLISGIFVLCVIVPEPLYDARYIIPITGMLLGNCLRANVISLERFYSSIRDTKDQHLTYLSMGADLSESVEPHFQAAVKSAVNPSLASIATIGLVSLPGMMTGQILGGSDPSVAVKYQVAIMICIFSSMTISTFLNIKITSRKAFDGFGILKDSIFR